MTNVYRALGWMLKEWTKAFIFSLIVAAVVILVLIVLASPFLVILGVTGLALLLIGSIAK